MPNRWSDALPVMTAGTADDRKAGNRKGSDMGLTARAILIEPGGHVSAQAEDAFFGAIRNPNRTFKKTRTQRLAALDKVVIDYLLATHTPMREILDIGISSGITTLDLIRHLGDSGLHPHVTATDLSMTAYLVPVSPHCSVLVDPAGHPLQYDLMGHAINPWQRRLDYVDGMLLLRAFMNRTYGARATRIVQERGTGGLQHVMLVSPRLTRAANLSAIEDNILVRNPDFARRFDFIRAANVLNHHCFDGAALRTALDNLASYASGPGALLLIARTLGAADHQGTLFRLAPDGRHFNVARRFGPGSEIESLVLETVL